MFALDLLKIADELYVSELCTVIGLGSLESLFCHLETILRTTIDTVRIFALRIQRRVISVEGRYVIPRAAAFVLEVCWPGSLRTQGPCVVLAEDFGSKLGTE